MYSRDPQRAEDGFAALREQAADHKGRLLQEYELASQESRDQFPLSPRRRTRGWLLELLSGIADEDLQSIFEAALDDDDVQHWAIAGLRAIDSSASRRILWEAGLDGR